MALHNRRIGEHLTVRLPGEHYKAYIPPPLPPDPPVRFDHLYPLLDQANQALGRLDVISDILPDHSLFLYMYIRKEAVLSSQIEGTQSSLSDLLLFESKEAPGVPIDDVKEVSRYVEALEHGLGRLKDGFPLSLRLIREIHAVLLSSARGQHQTPGEFRTSQNWIGGSRPGNAVFVPPPPDRLMGCLDNFEKFLHAEKEPLPILVKAAITHVQFETIHPFLDGNGRLGRLLITLLLCASGVLHEPPLYLSLYLKKNRTRYYDLLQSVRLEGAWEAWIEFFLRGVVDTAEQSAAAARQISALLSQDRQKIEKLGRPAGSALQVHQALQMRPIISVGSAATIAGMSFPVAQKSLRHLEDLGIVRESTGRQKGKLYSYFRYLEILGAGTEPLR